MIVVGSCYFLFTLLIPYDPNIDFVFPLSVLYLQETNTDSEWASIVMINIGWMDGWIYLI